MANKIRFVLLCEDRLQERFVRKVTARLGLDQIRVERAPSGRGSAVQFVLKRFPEEVKALRSKAHQRNLGLIAAIDGDRHGALERQEQLDRALTETGLEARKAEERIAIQAPTWSVESWIGHLSDISGIDESESYKKASWMQTTPKELARRLDDAATRFKELLDEGAVVPELPSLDHGLGELRGFKR